VVARIVLTAAVSYNVFKRENYSGVADPSGRAYKLLYGSIASKAEPKILVTIFLAFYTLAFAAYHSVFHALKAMNSIISRLLNLLLNVLVTLPATVSV
jgi:hypothetical protein